MKLLDAVESNGEASQRAIAENLGVSLGLVNSSFRQFLAAGYFKERLNRTGCVKYELTGNGLQEKARLAYEYILSSYRMYRDAIARLHGFFSELETLAVRRLVFFGVNDFAEMAYLGMKKTSLEMVAVVDENRIGQVFFGRTVESVSKIDTLCFDGLLITNPEEKAGGHVQDILSEKVISMPFRILEMPDFEDPADGGSAQ